MMLVLLVHKNDWLLVRYCRAYLPQSVRAVEITLRKKNKDRGGSLDARLELRELPQVIHIQKAFRAWCKLREATLDDGYLILASRPNVR
ncbi:hypothetical protein AB1Y20_022326 [Prymnesium parvum]|uniref:Uncharacterized protein n=1 Tax=Prymnesium parvum TaxID=97485 RepID=A0AB34JGL3_PRYPA